MGTEIARNGRLYRVIIKYLYSKALGGKVLQKYVLYLLQVMCFLCGREKFDCKLQRGKFFIEDPSERLAVLNLSNYPCSL